MTRASASLLVLGSVMAVCAGWAGNPSYHPQVRVFFIVFGVFLAGVGMGISIGFSAGSTSAYRDGLKDAMTLVRAKFGKPDEPPGEA